MKALEGHPTHPTAGGRKPSADIFGALRPICLLALPLAAPLVGCSKNPDPTGAKSETVPAQAAQAGPPWFEEVGAAVGLDFSHVSGAAGDFYMPEIMTTGAALFDADGDGDLDAYLAQGGSVTGDRGDRPGNRLFSNDGKGRFTDVTEGSGADDRGYAMGVATGDYDGDGDLDLFVSNLERNALLRNDGDMRFTDVTEAVGLAGENAWSASAAFFDMEGDGDLDLFVTNYIVWDADAEIPCLSPRGTETYCSPKSYKAPAVDQLFRNDGGTFVDISAEAGLGAAFGNGLGIVCADFDLDGFTEIFVANDGTPNQLWDRVDGTERFEDRGTILGCAVDLQGRAKAGMGVATADVDHDGDEDLLVVNLTGEDDSFYRNDAGSFVDKTPRVGLAGHSRKRTRFGVALRDFDLDGEFDLYHANGRVTEPAEYETEDPFAEENLIMRGTAKGRFTEVLPRGGLAKTLFATSRAAAFGDVDGDGDVDILIHNRDGAAHLMRNVAPRGAEPVVLDIRSKTGAPAIGATAIVTQGDRRTRYEVRTADSYGAASSHVLHVAARGAAGIDKVEVVFSDGTFAGAENLGPGEVHRIVQAP